MNWRKNLTLNIKERVVLKNFTSFKIGGPAQYFIKPGDARELKQLLMWVKQYKIPLRIIGAGSNILPGDGLIKGAVVKLDSRAFSRVIFDGPKVYVGSGVLLKDLLLKARLKRLSGLEFLSGIPGTVGGALVMNAGIPKSTIRGIVGSVAVMDYRGKVRILFREEIDFSYRKSSLEKYIVLGAVLILRKATMQAISRNTSLYISARSRSQDYRFPSAGCIFRNPKGNSAGRLIDACSLKGKKIGGACVSEKHANFIINRGNAKAADVLKLMNLIKRKVKSRFNINLQPEIKIWP